MSMRSHSIGGYMDMNLGVSKNAGTLSFRRRRSAGDRVDRRSFFKTTKMVI